MVAKAGIEAREADCSSAEDYAKLAIEALADPADNDYANQLSDKEYTADLLEQAADACFEGMEHAVVGNAYAALLDDKEKAVERFQEAADDLSDPANILTGWLDSG